MYENPVAIAKKVERKTDRLRLFGNMFAGGVIMGLLYMAVPWGIPAPLHLYFDLFMGLVQSFVFIMLSMVYIQGALGDSEYVEN